jgi:hypothetical protein
MRKLKLFAYALALLALAHPAAIPPALAVLGAAAAAVLAIVGWVLANLSLVCTVVAGVLLTRVFPGRLTRAARWLVRASVASVAVVAPVKA